METTEAEVREPTSHLRFVPRRGRMILQQLIKVLDPQGDKKRETWADVPVEEDSRGN